MDYIFSYVNLLYFKFLKLSLKQELVTISIIQSHHKTVLPLISTPVELQYYLYLFENVKHNYTTLHF